MVQRDPRIDAYIARQREFAQPILKHLRKVVHEGCPQVVETLKWNSPSFEHKGMLCGMAAFKEHAVFGFWKHELVVGDDPKARQAMGSFGCLRTLGDLPSKAALVRAVRKAVRLNDEGVTAPRRKTRPRTPVKMHPDLRAALARSKAARATYDAFPPSHQREYIEWVAEAKREDTRARRVAQAVEWMAKGKPRNWKYTRR